MNTEIISKYITDTFFSIYKKSQNVNISYGNDTGDIIIKKGDLSFFDLKKPIPDHFVWHTWEDRSLPFLFNLNKEKEILTVQENKIFINYDIFSASFYFLSNWQEIYQPKTDKYGRFPYKKSIQYRHDLSLIPVVNYYFHILKTAIEKLTGKTIVRKNSEDAFSVFLSHDIDKVKSGWLYDSFAEFKKGNLANMFNILFRKLRGIDDWNNLDNIIQLEDELGVSSTFFFLTESGGNNSDYKLKEVEPYFDDIKQSGSEIGIHGSLGAGLDPQKFKNEIKKLEVDISGNRFHYLKIDSSKTPSVIDKAGLDYSCSLGFAEQIGFRNGFCFPFRPFNLKTQKPFQHIQIPLMIMDTTLRNKNYMGVQSQKKMMGQIYQIVDEVEKFGGVLSILWHNSYFTDYKYAGWRKQFILLVQLLKNKSAHFYTGKHINDLYSDN